MPLHPVIRVQEEEIMLILGHVVCVYVYVHVRQRARVCVCLCACV